MKPRTQPVPNGLRGAFREEARRIISADRAARNTGVTQNTIAAIANALERAFKMGRDNPQDANAPDRSWEEIPPRARIVLMDLGFSARQGDSTRQAVRVRLVQCLNDAGKVRWRQEGDGPSGHSFSAGAVNPLVVRGLLAPSSGEPTILELSPAGLGAFERYWARRQAGDSSLPLEGMGPSKRRL